MVRSVFSARSWTLAQGRCPVRGVPQAHRAQRAVADGVRAAGRHDLDGHAALVDGERRVEIMQECPLGEMRAL